MKKRNIFVHVIVFATVFTVFFFFGKSCEKIGGWQYIAEGTLIVPADSVARWDSLLKLPPQVRYDTIYHDTGSYHVVYKDPPVPEPTSDSTYVLSDSLTTPYFMAGYRLGLQSKLSTDSVITSEWTYRYFGPTEIIKTVTEYVPKPVPYEVKVPASGFFAGGGMDFSKYSLSLGPTGSYLKNNWSYDLGLKYQYIFSQTEGGVLFSIGVKRKF